MVNCTECGKSANAGYELRMVVRARGKAAFTNGGEPLCAGQLSNAELQRSPSGLGDLLFAIDTPVPRPCLQPGQHAYLPRDVAMTLFPKSVEALTESPEWLQRTKDGWQPAPWAAKAYERLAGGAEE